MNILIDYFSDEANTITERNTTKRGEVFISPSLLTLRLTKLAPSPIYLSLYRSSPPEILLGELLDTHRLATAETRTK